MKRGWLGGLLAVGLITGVGCPNCDVDELTPKEPKINADACVKDGIAECSMSFSAPLSTAQIRKVKVKNVGESQLNFSSIRIADGSDPAFTVHGDIPTACTVDGDDAIISVRYAPTLASQVNGKLVIESNAANAQVVEVELTGLGRDQGIGQFNVSPPECNFGEVGRGSTGYCTLKLENQGSREVGVNEFYMETGSDPAFQPADVFIPPMQLPPGQAIMLRIAFSPTDVRSYEGAVVFVSTDAANERVTVPLHGAGGDNPTAVAKVASINGATPPAGPAQSCKPLDKVLLSGADSVASPGQQIKSYRWEWVTRPDGTTGKPPGSSVELTKPNEQITGFKFNLSGTDREGLDIAGTYEVKLTVTDTADRVSTNDARVTITAVPRAHLHIQLTWDHDMADLDLHLVKGAFEPFSSTYDCFFTNCKPNAAGGGGLDWGPESGVDPRLDVDDVCGYGPENINIDDPADGEYYVGVHFYGVSKAGCRDGDYENPNPQTQITEATIRIYAEGQLVHEVSHSMACGQPSYWKVAKIVWGSGAGIEGIDQLVNAPWRMPLVQAWGACGR